jgi:hypothetical protein
MGYGVSSAWINPPEREVDHCLPTDAEFKETWFDMSTLPHVFMR